MVEELYKKLEKVNPKDFHRVAVDLFREAKEDVRREYRFNVRLYLINILRKIEKDNAPAIS